MNRAIALAKRLVISGATLGAALLIADCLDCRAASRAGRTSVVALCAIVIVLMLGLCWYLLGKVAPNMDLENSEPAQRELEPIESTPALAAIYVSGLVLGGIWVLAVTTSRYPPVIPLMFLIAGAAPVALFGAAAEQSAKVRALLAAAEASGRWRWVAVSAGLGTLIVIPIVVYALDVLREHPLVGSFCAVLCLVMSFCGVYRSAFTRS